jgi:hypothetical protein
MRFLEKLSSIAVGTLILAGLLSFNLWISRETRKLEPDDKFLQEKLESSKQSRKDLEALLNAKEQDLEKFKSGLNNIAQAKKTVYESGLALQEEKRLLEKQLEMMTTSVRIDPEARKIQLMREDHSMSDFAVLFTSTHAFTLSQRKSQSLRITSKERFAHPERGKLEEKDGVLTWVPPQVGQSARANALGEFVIFTNSNIIVHGPYKKKAEHDAYPHVCAGLSLKDARKLYTLSFIGNKVAVLNAPGGNHE